VSFLFRIGVTNISLKKIDLHLHSNASDGIFSPSELIRIVATAGIRAAALTDHDTTAGLSEAEHTATQMGIEFVPGVEISTTSGEHEIHILGYYPRRYDELEVALNKLRKDRYRRMELMINKLKGYGFKIKLEDLLFESGGAAPGRLHLARLLLNKKYVHSLDQAFSLYLRHDRPAYVPREGLKTVEAVDLLVSVGAIPVIAHPGTTGTEIIEKLIAKGLKGIEVYHPDHSRGLAGKWLKFALLKGLIATGGSDYHGDTNSFKQYPVYHAVDYNLLEGLKTLHFQLGG
jgi:3',5'-nucleoside bisphosphate phosphatase